MDDHDGCIWALNPAWTNKSQGGLAGVVVTDDPFVASLVLLAFAERPLLPKLPSVMAIAALENDLRMLVQQAAFTIHRDPSDLRDLATSEPILRQFIVPKAEKPKIRELLRLAGIVGASLFPDLAGLAADIKRGNFPTERRTHPDAADFLR
jgi:hypothetical protein